MYDKIHYKFKKNNKIKKIKKIKKLNLAFGFQERAGDLKYAAWPLVPRSFAFPPVMGPVGV